MTIEIINLRKEKPKHPWDVRVDRHSLLGNPFLMRDDEDARDYVCDKYDVWFEAMVHSNLTNKNEWVVRELNILIALYKKHGKLRLFCWCAPKRCHAETIRKYILESGK